MPDDGEKYDVIIVGSGPAGSILGYELSRRGAKTLIIEKCKLPRYKPCGGGLTLRTLRILPFEVCDVIEDYSYTANIAIDNTPVFSTTLRDDPVIGMIMRDKFDHFLVRKAIDAGCRLCDGTSFKSSSGTVGDLHITTTKGQFRTRILVGADGVNSKVAKAIDLQGQKRIMRALEAEVYYKDSLTIRKLKNSVYFELGVIPKGYGWIFPKADHLSIGVVTTSRRTGPLRHYLEAFMETAGLHTSAEIVSIKGHPIPYRPGRKNRFANRKGLLVGDAVGFTDPITGEGIYYAVSEALIASEIIVKSLEQCHDYMEEYNRVIKSMFLREMVYAQRLSKVVYGLSNYGCFILKKFGKQVGRCHVQIVCGKSTYRMLYFKLLNFPWILSKIVRALVPRKEKSIV